MAVLNNKKRPWLDDDPKIQNRLWVTENQNEIAKILPDETCIARVSINCHDPIIPSLFGLIFLPLIGGGPFLLFPFDIVLRYWGIILLITVVLFLLDAFIFRKAKGYIEIYSEMFVFYEYDEDWKQLYLSECYDWKDVTRYDYGIDGIRIDFISGDYICFKAKRKEFYPYLLRYAPQAKKLTYEERKMRAKAAKKAEKEQDKNID